MSDEPSPGADAADVLPPRLRALARFFTPEIIAAAAERLINGKPLPREFSKGARKLALLLVLEWNPNEIPEENEECSVRGVTDKTLRGMKQRRELPAVYGGVNTVVSDS